MTIIEYEVRCATHGYVGRLVNACIALDVTLAHRLRATEECGEISILPIVEGGTSDAQVEGCEEPPVSVVPYHRSQTANQTTQVSTRWFPVAEAE